MSWLRSKESDKVSAVDASTEKTRPETDLPSHDEPGQERETSVEQAAKPAAVQVEPVVKQEEPIVEQAVETPAEQVEQPAEHVVEPPVEKVEQQAEQAVLAPVEQPVEQAVDLPAERVEQPAAQAAVAAFELPVERPVVEQAAEQVEPETRHEEFEIEHARLLAEVRRLELELARYRKHAQRTSQLFLSVTKYTEWVRENARRDAELALRKATARARKLEGLAREREQTEHEVARLKAELSRLQTLTDETRTRLVGFLTAGLQALNPDVEVNHGDDTEPKLRDIQETLRERLAPTPAQPEA